MHFVLKITMLVDEHANADTAHQESVQKVLDLLLGLVVYAVRFLHLQYAHGHVLHHVAVTVHDVVQRFGEPNQNKQKWVSK